MTSTRKKYSREFKVNLIREIEAGKSVAQVSRQHDIHPAMIHQWKRAFQKYGEQAFKGNGNSYTEEARIGELERMIGQLTVENTLLKKVLRNLEAPESLLKRREKKSS